MDGWPLRTSLSLTVLPSAAYWARRHTEEALRTWGLTTAVAETAVLVVSELIANGVEATAGRLSERERELYDNRPCALPYERIAALGTVRLRLARDHGRVLIEVWDQGAGVPVLRAPDEKSASGRGLLLVNSLCGAWGWYPVWEKTPERHKPLRQKGKVVWGELTGA